MYGYDRRERSKESKELEHFENDYAPDGPRLPKKMIVCPTCRGKGTHVNPSIDAHGLSREDFDQDPDFYRDYMTGMYDVSCYECKGRNVVEVVDDELAKRTMPELYKEWLEWLQDAYDYDAECAMERRMGC